MKRSLAVVVASVTVAALAAAPNALAGDYAEDYADTALNIIPSGQYGGVVINPKADDQALMYDGLTPLFDDISEGDLTTYFKSEAIGNLGTDGPALSTETLPRNDVTITRDQFNVPHVKADTEEAGVWAAGWIAAKDRGLLLQQARYNSRVAAIDVPGLSAITLVSTLQNFRPSPQTEAAVAEQEQALLAHGAEGQAVLNDIDTFIEGINAYLDSIDSANERWTRNDVFAVNSLKSQFLGQGGGDEARRTQFYSGLQERLGDEEGRSVFNDLRQFKNPESPTTIDGKFKYGKLPKKGKTKGNVIIDPDSYETVDVTPGSSPPADQPSPNYSIPSGTASNTLMINAEESATGNPLMVGGPQIGYFYPGLTYEIDMDAGDLKWRGATSAPFPGYLLIGRGEDFATTLTSASADVIDQFAETLCEGSDLKYMYNGECLDMELFEAGTLGGQPVEFYTTVHGPVTGYATVDGEKVAISRQRSGYGEDVVDLLFNRRISNGSVENYEDFFDAAAQTPQTFNSFYIDHEHVAEYTAGKLPIRNKKVDPGLLTDGTGKFEWEGVLDPDDHPHGIDPEDGTMTNWNETVAHGFSAADENFGRNGSVMRVDLLDENLDRLKGSDDKWDLAEVTAAMNAGATQDVRAIRTVPLLHDLLTPGIAPSAEAQKAVHIMVAWNEAGGSRLDVNLDGEIDHPGAAIMDRAWPKIADAFMEPQLGPQLDELASLFSRYDLPPGGQYSGWHQYFDRDIRDLLGKKVDKPFKNDYCGDGDEQACRDAVWAAIQEAVDELTAEQGPDLEAWRADAVRERIRFAPGLLPTTMRYTNRPSGIQQVISFDGHR